MSEEQIDTLDRNIHMELSVLKHSTILKWKFEELFATSTAVPLSTLESHCLMKSIHVSEDFHSHIPTLLQVRISVNRHFHQGI
jgi:hypothetical protein